MKTLIRLRGFACQTVHSFKLQHKCTLPVDYFLNDPPGCKKQTVIVSFTLKRGSTVKRQIFADATAYINNPKEKIELFILPKLHRLLVFIVCMPQSHEMFEYSIRKGWPIST